ncbi:MAG: chemotaxis protein CheA [Deltaproteobacteria bacterium]|nr:chemotaxis protein CheA [Deltaproteobacteria bacterium]
MAASGKGGAGSKAQREFVSEAEDILERMRDDLSELAESEQAGTDPDPDLINRIFRSAHSLKGLSGMFGLESLSELAHHLEDLLDGLRMGRVALRADGLALFDDAIEILGLSLAELQSSEIGAATRESISALLQRIEGFGGGESVSEPTLGDLKLSPSILRALTEYEEHRLRDNLRRGRGIYVVEVDFEIASFEEGLAEVTAAIKEIGEILSTLPSPGETPDSHIRFSLLTGTDLEAADLAERLELAPELVETAMLPRPKSTTTPDAAVASAGRTKEEARNHPEPEPEHDAASEPASLRSISGTVRVDIRKLDELMNLVGELALQKGALNHLAARLSADPNTLRAGTELGKIYRGLERKLSDLQAGVLEVRMVPLRQVFDKLARVVRRLRLDLHKDVRLEVSGVDTELDKLIVEGLVDPLMHLVRNAFDHAIEAPAERVRLGKDAEGTIRLEAIQRGNDVVIRLSDDGRGIDAERVLARARQQGLVSAQDQLTEREVLDLIFHPGLSTRDVVTETSGRGVGMDVVRSNIAALGGIVDIESTHGRGTAISITLPITLAIIQALIVGVGEHTFAVPLNSVRETLLVDPSKIQKSEGSEILNLRGEPLALRRLAREFAIEAEAREGKIYVVVLGMGDARMGLIVDRLEGQQDAVIKPIQGPIHNVRGIAGATELGEQGAVLVLDVSAFIEDLTRRTGMSAGPHPRRRGDT